MKRIQTFYMLMLAALLALTVSSCYKDKGNYKYSAVNQLSIRIDTIASDATITVNQADTLRLNPVITQTLGKDESKFTYEWMIFDNAPTSVYSSPQIVIATSRNLQAVIAEPNFTLGQRYRMSFKVTDTTTGAISFFAFNIAVSNRFAKGWIFLEDLPNGGDFSMLLPGGAIVHNVFAQTNPGVNMGAGVPVRLDISVMDVNDAITSGSKKIYIHHPGNAIELSYQTLKKKFDIANVFFNPPAVMKPQALTWFSPTVQPNTASLGVMVNNDKVYIAEIGGYPGAKKFGGALMTPAGNNDYTATPWIASGLSFPIVYDSKYRRFYIVRPTKLDNLPDTVSTVISLNNLGMDMVNMDESNVPRAYNVILKDNAGVRQLLRITFSPSSYVLTSFIQPMTAPGIENATAIASTTGSPHIFYGVGSLLYRYETTSNTSTQPFTFPAGETIVKIKCQAGTEMVIATWDGSTGRVYRFGITATGAFTGNTYSAVYTGFGRVIDIGYKN